MRFAGWAFLAAVLSGCAARPVAPTDYYRLPAPATVARFAQPALKGVLRVERPIAGGLLQGRAIVYGTTARPDRERLYRQHLWALAPAALIQDSLISALRRAHVADEVVGDGVRARARYVLSGHLRRFSQWIGKDRSSVLVDIGFALRCSGDGRLRWAHDYRVRRRAVNAGVAAAVQAFGAAMARVQERLLADLAATHDRCRG